MRVITIVGARPQFIKAAPVSKAFQEYGLEEILIHTGQHYDHEMSQIFFDEMGIPQPEINLEIGSGTHATQTARMLVAIDDVLVRLKPDAVMVYGDTNSTLAGALAAVKRGIPLAHVEAGLRSYNRDMPEEHNRVLTDHCSDLLFCPTETAVENLGREGINAGVHLVGDTMYDATLQFADVATCKSTILEKLGLESKKYLLATIHRAYNTDNDGNLRNLIEALLELDETVVFPVHPRTQAKLTSLTASLDLDNSDSKLVMIDPVGYLDMLVLERNARVILTDSGGMQKEAFFFQTPCITLRPETEWIETVSAGWNRIVGTDVSLIRAGLKQPIPDQPPPQVFGDGCAAGRIAKALVSQASSTTVL